jgi:hypothetical protein
VLIDETLDDKEPVTEPTTHAYAKSARALLTPAEQGEGFGQHYFEALQRDPDVIMAHAAMVKASGIV